MHYLKLYYKFLQINLNKALIYRGNFVLGMVLVMIESIVTYIAVVVLFTQITSVAGWGYSEMLVLSGVFMVTQALTWLLYRSSIRVLDVFITNGYLDGLLIKPVDTQFLATVHRIDIEDAARSVVGIVIMVVGLMGVTNNHLLWGIPLFIITLLCGQAVLYSLTLGIKCISFKSIQGWGTNAIFWRFHDLARFPTDVYTGIMRVIYTYIFPLIFIATVPTKALTGELTIPLFLGSLLAAVIFLYLARRVWLFALRTYSSASS